MRYPRQQSGTVLIVAILLLLIASILTFFTLNMSVFEQQASGNDVKAKIVGQIADAGLAQGMEYLHQNYTAFTDTSKWTLCTDSSFPCGTVPASRRATMYYWSSGGHDFDGSGSISGWEQHMMPLTQVVTTGVSSTAGTNYNVEYGVGAVMCRLATKASKSAATTCTDSASATNASVITVVSTAYIPSEGARATVMQSFGTTTLFNNLTGAPPIVASGSINLVGTIQIVTNPNGGGTGVPVSIWTPQSLNGNGTGNSCYANEFYTSGGTVDWSHTGLTSFPLCDDCSCDGSLSSVKGNSVSNGIDSLSGDDNSASGGNAAVHVDSDQSKTEFPCDLFQQIFGISAWEDDWNQTSAGSFTEATNGASGTAATAADKGKYGDGFCETHIMVAFQNPNNTSQYVKMGADEAYLYSYAGYIKAKSTRTYPVCTDSTCASTSGTVTAASLRQSSQTTALNYGLVWCQDGTMCATGTADNPALIVFDGSGPDVTASDVYGFVFGRSVDDGSTGDTTAPDNSTVLERIAGGDANFTMHSNGALYGAIVLQGTTGHLNGTSDVVYNKDILTNLAKEPGNTQFGGMPGSWSDRTSY